VKLKTQTLYITLIYTISTAYMLGPMLSYKAGIPRIDNPLTILLLPTALLIFALESKRFNGKAGRMLAALAIMCGWGGIHLFITTLDSVRIMDTFFFLSLPSLFYLLYLVLSRHENPMAFIRHLLLFFCAFIIIPPAVEILTGIQFVQADEVLAIDAGIIKGFFFNPNNLGTTALCFAPAVLVFFNIDVSKKEYLLGLILFLCLGVVIFASASRTATLCYIILFILNLIYRNNGLFTLMTIGVTGAGLSMIPKQYIADFLLSLHGNAFLENISSRLYLFLFDLESDNSVGYRQEIYNYFWEHPPFLLLGYGPKKFQEYFGGHLSDSLAFENPHSFLIELYLGFGLISLMAFLFYAAYYFFCVATGRTMKSKQRVIGLAAMGLFLLAGFIPSTILRMPFIWLPCFLIFLYSVLPQRDAAYNAYRYTP
jgi:hypothetical protein